MPYQSYRGILAIPGFTTLIVVAFLVRIPVAGASMALTLYVAKDLHRGYGAAGAIVAAATIGTSLGAPLLGRLIDRKGLRVTLVIATVGEATLWFVAPILPFTMLLPFVAIICIIRIPIYSITKQVIAAMVPADSRRQAFALDSMAIELSFMVGPALVAFLVVEYSGALTFALIGACMIVAGITLVALNLSTVTQDFATAVPPRDDLSDDLSAVSRDPYPCEVAALRTTRSALISPDMLVQFVIIAAATLALSGSEVSVVATLRSAGQTSHTGYVFVVWCAASLIGGLIFGAITRPVSPGLVVGSMAILTIPIGFAQTWMFLAFILIPAGMLCAPAFTVSTEAVTHLAPPQALGEVLGWHGAAATVGVSVGAPLAGTAIDRFGPPLGFVVVGGISLVVVCIASGWSLWLRHTSKKKDTFGVSKLSGISPGE